ncbi:hypothetical protein LXL04_007733 [Taraxacum kok-saghyz]
MRRRKGDGSNAADGWRKEGKKVILKTPSTKCDGLDILGEDVKPWESGRPNKHHFIRDISQKGEIELFYVPTTEQLADLFTKALDEQKIHYPIGELSMLSLE